MDFTGPSSPQLSFAREELQRALEGARAGEADPELIFERSAAGHELRPEGFSIRVQGKGKQQTVRVIAPDDAGLMYGGLELAEIIRTAGVDAIRDDTQNPYLAMRGTKFNIPLDLRSPSYTDPCDAAQSNIPEMWSRTFWRGYIDTLARNRYNYISLWSLHPFPSLVKVPGYEDVALDDVWRSKRMSRKKGYALRGTNFLDKELLEDVEVLLEMSIDEKIAFWREVMAYGKSRNVDLYFVTWNIFDYGTFGKYGVTDAADNEVTTDYFRKSVKQMFVTYPDLAGIGLTTGENMGKLSREEKEAWAFATYGQGVLDAAAELPGRKITLIHRQHETGAEAIARTFKPLVDHPDIEFIFSFKYAKAHVMSATRQPYHEDFVKDIALHDMETVWTLRNDSNYHFRWGAPDFVRTFFRNLPGDVSRGYYYGSDGFTWGRDFLQRDPGGSRPLEVDRHWFHWLLWGRLGYHPDLSNDRLQHLLAARFGLDAQDATTLFDAWQDASMVYPTVTGFHWGSLDFQWYIEGCQSKPSFAKTRTGFHDVNRFITLAPHLRSGCQSIPDFVTMTKGGGTTDLRTPPDVADTLLELARGAGEGAHSLSPAQDAELARTLQDIEAMAKLGAYYAHKIRGAVELALFREGEDEAHRLRAVGHLEQAARVWKAYAETALAGYRNPLWMNRVDMFDWKQNYTYTLEDIRIAGGDPKALGLPAELKVANEPIERKW